MWQLSNSGSGSASVTDAVGQTGYWESVDELVGKVVSMLDEKEDWVIEGHPQFQAVLSELLDEIRKHPNMTEFALEHPKEAFKLMAYLHSSTAMMILHISDQSRPTVVTRFIEAATSILQSNARGEVAVAANLALDRFFAFERAALLQRIFSHERVDGVILAVERAGMSAQRRRAGSNDQLEGTE